MVRWQVSSKFRQLVFFQLYKFEYGWKEATILDCWGIVREIDQSEESAPKSMAAQLVFEGLVREASTLFRRRSCEKVAPAGQFETGDGVSVTCRP